MFFTKEIYTAFCLQRKVVRCNLHVYERARQGQNDSDQVQTNIGISKKANLHVIFPPGHSLIAKGWSQFWRYFLRNFMIQTPFELHEKE